MKIAFRSFAAVLFGVLVWGTAWGQTTYTWNQTGTAAWSTAGNWTPSRTTPAADDILVFDNGANTTATGVPTQTIGQLLVSNGTTVNLQASAAVTLTIAGGAGVDLSVAAGSALNCNSASAVSISVGAAATGGIAGSMAFTAAAHRLLGGAASAITFQSGSQFSAGTGFSGNPFGTTSLNSVVFAAGSVYAQSAGSNPFGAGQPSSVVVFQGGSLFRLDGAITPSFSGRTYANFEHNHGGATSTTGGSPLSIDNLTVTLGTMNIGMTGSFSLKGNVVVNPGATLTFNAASAATVTLNGSAAQTVTNNGAMTFNATETVDVNNPLGLTVNGNVTFHGPVTLTNGAVAVNNNVNLNAAISATGGSLAPAAASTVVYGQGSNGQAVLAANYGNLAFSNFTKSLPAAGTVRIAGTFTPGTAVGHAVAGSTVEFNGTSAQSLPAGFTPYHNLTLANAAGVSGFAGLTVNTLLRVASGTFTSASTYRHVLIDAPATLEASAGSMINVSGNWTNNGGFVAGTGTVVFDGSSEQTIGGASSTTFNHLTLNNPSGATLATSATVEGTLTFVSGKVTTGANTLSIGVAGSVVGASAGTGWVVGNLGRSLMPSGGEVSGRFDVGDAARYAPVDLDLHGLAATRDVTASTTPGDHPNLGTSDLDAAKTVNRFHTLSSPGGPGFTSYDATFHFDPADVDAGANLMTVVVRKYDAPNWSSPATGVRTSTSTQATGMTSFSDFAIGNTVAFPVRNVDTGNGYTTIQAAISDPATLGGHTIEVSAGTYSEALVLNKRLNLRGAKAGSSACDRVPGAPDPAEESIVSGATSVPRLLQLVTGSAGSVIDGFSFIGGTRGIESTSGPIDDLAIRNNHFAGFVGSAVFLNDNGNDVTVSANNIDGSGKTGAGGSFHLDTDIFGGFHFLDNCVVNGVSGTGFFVDGNRNVRPSVAREPRFSGNLIHNHSTNSGVNLGSRAFTDGTISGNRFTNNKFDGLQGGMKNTSVTSNRFANNGRWGLSLTSFGNTAADRGAQSCVVTGNTFTNNDSAGYFISATQAPGNAASNRANNNDIVGNAAASHRLGAIYRGTETIDVGCNWWGDIGGPNYPPANSNPAGDGLFAASATFAPWLDGSITGMPACDRFPPVATTTAVSSDRNPAGCGEKINLGAAVSPSSATGAVEFLDGGNPLGTATLSGGVATLSVTYSVGGRRAITARYQGDGQHLASASGTLIQQVNCPPASETRVRATSCDPLGWAAVNVRPGGSVAITDTYPRSGHGSLEFNTADAVAKADFERVNGNADLLATLSALQVDLYRNSSSTAAGHLAPAVRLLVDNGQAVNRFSLLIWEPVYNGIATFPTDAWGTYDLYKHNFWMRAFKTTGGVTIEIFNRTLSDWLAPGTVTDGGGNVSNEVGPNARVLAYNVGVGSGWSGTFAGAADNFRIGFNGADSVFNFEPPTPTTLALAADPAKSVWGEKVTLTATVTPGDATGSVAFSDGMDALGTAPVVNGQATLSVTGLAVGGHAFTAAYTPSGCFLGSSSDPVAHEVNRAPTTTTLASDNNPAKFGTKVTLTATVEPAAATGTVTFRDGGQPLGTAPVVDGEATLSVTDFANGEHSLVAEYGGDDCYLPSESVKLVQVVADENAPRVTVISPNGGEVLIVGTPTKISWTAEDDKGVTSVDICLSRDGGTTFEDIATGLANDGTFTWMVTGPANNTGPEVVFRSLVKIKARDAAGNLGTDVSDDLFAIYDLATEVLARFQAGPARGGVEVRWRLAAPELFADVALERAEAVLGPWVPVAGERRDEGGEAVVLDAGAIPGRTYYYRLSATAPGGSRVTFGPVRVETGVAATEFALGDVAPNPTRGATRIDYAVARESHVRLSVIDLQGREVAVLAEGSHRPGRYQATWSGEGPRGSVPAGIYFVRYQTPGGVTVRRLALTR